MLLEQVSTDKEFYKSLKRLDEGDGDKGQEDADDDDDDKKAMILTHPRQSVGQFQT